MTLHSGRYGPYVKHGRINATVPAATDPETLTLDGAVALIDAKKAKTPAKATKKPAAKRKKKPAAKSKAKASAADAADASTGS